MFPGMFLLFTQLQMVLISRHGLQIFVYNRRLETIGYVYFADLKKWKKMSIIWIKCEIGKLILLNATQFE